MQCSKGRDAALAGLAVKVVQLEALLSSKQAQLQEMGATEQTWLEDAQRLRQAVANTLGALGMAAAKEVLELLSLSAGVVEWQDPWR